jgi:hypothetical protein
VARAPPPRPRARGRPEAIEPEAGASRASTPALEESVALHQRTRRALGLFLSGGTDSAASCAMMARLNEAPVTAFTAGFDVKGVADERDAARRVATAAGARHVEVEVTEAMVFRHLPEIVAAMDDPAADYAIIPTWFLARHAREEVKVVLSGEGGDEILGGYGRYRAAMRPWWLWGRAMRARGAFDRLDVLRAEPRFWRDGIAAAETTAATPGRSRLQVAQAVDVADWLPNDLLVKLDRCLMAHGVEGRVPAARPRRRRRRLSPAGRAEGAGPQRQVAAAAVAGGALPRRRARSSPSRASPCRSAPGSAAWASGSARWWRRRRASRRSRGPTAWRRCSATRRARSTAASRRGTCCSTRCGTAGTWKGAGRRVTCSRPWRFADGDGRVATGAGACHPGAERNAGGPDGAREHAARRVPQAPGVGGRGGGLPRARRARARRGDGGQPGPPSRRAAKPWPPPRPRLIPGRRPAAGCRRGAGAAQGRAEREGTWHGASGFDLVLRGGALVLPWGVEAGRRASRAGASPRSATCGRPARRRRSTAPGCTCCPGLIDAHVHLRDPGDPAVETLATGTRAAVLGGLCAVFDMPNTAPSITDRARLDWKREHLQGRRPLRRRPLRRRRQGEHRRTRGLELEPNVCAVKVFAGSSTGDLLVEDDESLEAVMRSGRRRVCYHSRTSTACRSAAPPTPAAGRTGCTWNGATWSAPSSARGG